MWMCEMIKKLESQLKTTTEIYSNESDFQYIRKDKKLAESGLWEVGIIIYLLFLQTDLAKYIGFPRWKKSEHEKQYHQ